MYSISAERTASGKDEVIIRLAAAKGWHLNGAGYPAVVVTIPVSEPSITLSCSGVPENGRCEWTVLVPHD